MRDFQFRRAASEIENAPPKRREISLSKRAQAHKCPKLARKPSEHSDFPVHRKIDFTKAKRRLQSVFAFGKFHRQRPAKPLWKPKEIRENSAFMPGLYALKPRAKFSKRQTLRRTAARPSLPYPKRRFINRFVLVSFTNGRQKYLRHSPELNPPNSV
ncbi:MAG: hypothetical protein DBX55_08755 [Verrucomicrobia bacterium]|nr:MAG: hypothetical protein DBX55_08755 [Verrucomicrobiota bacterium]